MNTQQSPEEAERKMKEAQIEKSRLHAVKLMREKNARLVFESLKVTPIAFPKKSI